MELALDNIFEAMDQTPSHVYVEALNGLVQVNHNMLFNSLCTVSYTHLTLPTKRIV